jgi:trypsin
MNACRFNMVARAAAAIAAVACADTSAHRGEATSAPAGAAEVKVEIGRGSEAIIGGLVALNPVLDHTGALTYRIRETGQTDGLCSASLIAPQTVVTAKHCISQMIMFEQFGIDVFWSPGPDFNAPIESIPVVAVAGSPGDEPGLAGYGRDVGVAHLDTPSRMPTIDVQPFSPDLLGVSMVTLGFGVSSAAGLIDGQRRIGRETVAAVEGNAYAALFGDFETFVELTVTGKTSELDIIPSIEADPSLADLDALRAEFDAAQLLPGEEVIGGKAPGDSQNCELDSGGPLALVTADGQWQAFGVESAGPRTIRPVCALGDIFSVFGPITFPFLEGEKSWVDPCGDVSVGGECEGDQLRRCESSFASNLRRLVEEDCAASGGICVASDAGASCSIPGDSIPGDAGADAG